MKVIYRNSDIEATLIDGTIHVYEPKQLNKKRSPLEHDEQCLLVGQLRRKKIAHHSIPNGGNRSLKTAATLKREGMMAGVPDLYVVDRPTLPPHSDLFTGYPLAIELKRSNGRPSNVSVKQKKWLKRLDSQGWLAVVCYGHLAALTLMELAGYDVQTQ